MSSTLPRWSSNPDTCSKSFFKGKNVAQPGQAECNAAVIKLAAEWDSKDLLDLSRPKAVVTQGAYGVAAAEHIYKSLPKNQTIRYHFPIKMPIIPSVPDLPKIAYVRSVAVLDPSGQFMQNHQYIQHGSAACFQRGDTRTATNLANAIVQVSNLSVVLGNKLISRTISCSLTPDCVNRNLTQVQSVNTLLPQFPPDPEEPDLVKASRA